MAHTNHSLRGHSVQMGNFCIEEFLLQRQTELLGWVGVQEAPQNPGKRYFGDTALLTVGHRQQVTKSLLSIVPKASVPVSVSTKDLAGHHKVWYGEYQ